MISFRHVSHQRHKATLERLQKICLPYDKPYFSPGWYWIGYDGDKPVAFCVASPSLRWTDTVYLARAGVIPDYRGMGLQKRMIAMRERLARRKGYVWSVTDTTNNPASSNSLISKGYRLFDPSKPWAYGYSLYWRKKL